MYYPDNQSVAVVGMQWGDEGKGKIVDMLAGDFDIVVRWNAGPNAGHTVYHDGKKFKLHQVPSGVFADKILIIGPECYVDITKLHEEIAMLVDAGFFVTLNVDSKATLISEKNIDYDQAAKCEGIKTTGCGIGPAAASRSHRTAQTVGDITDQEWDDLFGNLPSQYSSCKRTDTTVYIEGALEMGFRILFEGAQAIGLDNIHGDYPYVSQRCMTGGIFTSFGLLPKLRQLKVIGVAKAYVTRSGAGPMPSEMNDGDAKIIRAKGQEYGVTTGRARRIGWFDADQLLCNIRLSGADEVILTKGDILQDVDNVKIMAHDKYEIIDPFSDIRLSDVVDKIEDLIGTRISFISHGPKRSDIHRRKHDPIR